jgi:outer membrane receptor protein involved in Fe transport
MNNHPSTPAGVTASRIGGLMAVCISSLLLPSSFAQTAATPEKAADPVLHLTPFIVDASRDTGYRATNTLSGTRLSTSLRDVGTSIQAITQEFLEDTGVTEITELLKYTTSSEVTGGAGGNFSNAVGSTAVFSSDTTARSESAPTRIRGLAEASISRNLYPSVIPFDSYNIDRVEVNRGANSVLFGLGSPAGIINYNLNEVKWKNVNKVELRADHFGSFRTMLDINRVLAKDKFAFRLIGLNDETKYKQDPSFRDDRRYYATATYRPFKDTQIAASFEKGWIDSSLPRLDPPRDYFTHFFTTGPYTIPNNVDLRDAPGGTAAYVQNDSGTSTLHVFDGPNSSGTGVVYLTSGGTGINPGAVNPARRNSFSYGRRVLQNGRELLTNVFNQPQGVNAYALTLVDPTVFDFFNNTLDGTASQQYADIEAITAALRQQFLDGNAGIEIGFDQQTYNSGYFDALDGIRGNALMVDVSGGELAYATPGDPNSGQAPNPDYLRPLIGSRGNFTDRTNESQTVRATAFIRHDFTERSDGFLARLLGKQNVTLLASDYQQDFGSYSGIGAFMDYDELRAIGFTDTQARANNIAAVGTSIYIGDSVAGRTSASGLNLQGYKGDFGFPDRVKLNYIDGTTRAIRTSEISVHHMDNEPHDRLATSGSLRRDTLRTFASVLQSYWWDSTLITTLGWRRDEVERYSLNTDYARRPDQTIIVDSVSLDTTTPLAAETKDTLSYGGVVRLNKLVGRFMPKGVEVDLHYAWSENFQGFSGVRSVSGGFYDAPVGDTEEKGFSMSLLDDRLFFRANWFETSQQNLADADIDQPITTITAQIPNALYQRYTVAELQAAGFAMPPSLIESGAIVIGPPNADGYSEKVSIFTPRDIKAAVTKGFEFESTYNVTRNWRVAVNVAQVKATESGKGLNWADTVDWLKKNWFDNPSVAALRLDSGSGLLSTVKGWEDRAITNFISAQERNGASNPEIREWRVNAVTNYTFSSGRLKGFGVGGGVRFQDKPFIGYYGKQNPADPAGPLIADVTKPMFGPTTTDFDFWVSYTRLILSDKVRMKLQLNLRNAFTHNELIPIKAQQTDLYSTVSAFDHYAATDYRLYRIAAPRTVQLRATFEF